MKSITYLMLFLLAGCGGTEKVEKIKYSAYQYCVGYKWAESFVESSKNQCLAMCGKSKENEEYAHMLCQHILGDVGDFDIGQKCAARIGKCIGSVESDFDYCCHESLSIEEMCKFPTDDDWSSFCTWPPTWHWSNCFDYCIGGDEPWVGARSKYP